MKITIIIVCVVLIVLEWKFIRVNFTPSVPVGLYWRSGDPHRGDMVELCAPDDVTAEAIDRGYLLGLLGPCYHHSAVFIKVLAAVSGDAVDVSARGMSIDGKAWPDSQRRYFSRDGKPIVQWMPYGRYRLPSDRVLILGTNPESFDSRVFGPVKSSSLRARLTPILTAKGY